MPIQAAQYKIRHLRRHEIEQLLQLCKAEGRHMGTVTEVQTWMQIDPRGFFVAVTKQGQIIGSCCGMRLSPSHGYVGMYVVDKAFRGLGIGKEVWDAAMKHLGTRNNGLSAVEHLFTLYRDKAGFSHVTEWTVDLWRLDNMEIIFHCKHHQQRLQRNSRPINLKLDHLMFEYYRNSGMCGQLGSCDVNRIDTFDDQCNFFCLMHEYENILRKYRRQRQRMNCGESNTMQTTVVNNNNNNNNTETSDDESYGFSSLFFDEEVVRSSESHEIDDQDLRSDDENDDDCSSEMVLVPPNQMDLIELYSHMMEFGLKMPSYCNSYQCSSGKLRTVMLNGNDQLVEDVVEYDRRMHSYDRNQIVRLTLAEDNCLTRVALLGQTVVGYSCVKPNLQNMWIITPLYADNEYVARLLMLDLVTDLTFIQYRYDPKMSSSIVLKTPSNNHRSAEMLKSLGFIKQDYSLRRCYTKQIFEVPTNSIYALHTSVFCTE